MRRQRFWWTYLVGCIVCIVYGGWTLIYHFRKGNGLSIHALILLIIGGVCLVFFLILCLIDFIRKPKKKELDEQEEKPIEETIEEPKEQQVEEPEKVDDSPQVIRSSNDDVEYVSSKSSSYRPTSRNRSETIYVKKVGYGPVLRFEGEQILDMRNNIYYRFQGNYVYLDGGGVAYEISGNRIRSAFGSYSYEVSGSNINKVFGGFFASISGNYITKFDSSEKYESTGNLNTKQLLVVAALLFEE